MLVLAIEFSRSPTAGVGKDVEVVDKTGGRPDGALPPRAVMSADAPKKRNRGGPSPTGQAPGRPKPATGILVSETEKRVIDSGVHRLDGLVAAERW
jgi:hypothetical protein